MTDPAEPAGPARPGWVLVLLVAVAAASAAFRIREAVTDPNVRGRPASALLVTDPALIYHYTQEVADNGGRPPADWGADRSIEYPEAVDTWSMFTYGQEFLVAWAHLATGQRFELHVVAIWVMGVVASLCAVFVGLLALELTRSRAAAACAGALWAALPVAYRTVGFCFIREDLALPLFALHLWLAARAARTGSRPACALAGASAALALAAWHALGSVLLVEAACVAAWFARTGRNPLAAANAWLVPVAAAAVGLAVPILRAKLFLLSTPMLVAWALFGAGLLARRRALGRGAQLAAFAVLLAALFGASQAVAARTGGGARDYAHVVELLAAKLSHGGRMPEDPSGLSFGARVLWQGPFSTAPWESWLRRLGPGLVGFAVAAWIAGRAWLGGRGDARAAVLVLFAAAALVLSKLIVRLEVLAGLLLPVAVAVAATRLTPRALGAALGGASVAGGLVATWLLIAVPVIPWYRVPIAGVDGLDEARLDARTDLMDWIAARLPEGAPVATDYFTGAAVLAHTGHPVTQQPKYETVASRDRIQRYLELFFTGRHADFLEHVRSLGVRYLVVNDLQMRGNAWPAGLRLSESGPRPGTAAAAFLHPDPRYRRAIQGATQLYRTPKELWIDPLAIQWFQVYDLQPDADGR